VDRTVDSLASGVAMVIYFCCVGGEWAAGDHSVGSVFTVAASRSFSGVSGKTTLPWCVCGGGGG
jgi:hypothetical protein